MINYIGENLQNAKNMRKNMTSWEGRLWHLFLKNYKIKFYRQRLIEKYIVDFYCPKARLAVELDGSQHRFDENIKYDNERTCKLNELGIEVLRISNLDIDKNLEGVVLCIMNLVEKRIETFKH